MKSIYESIKGIMSEGAATNPNAQGKEYTNPKMPGYYKNKNQPATTAKPAAPAPAAVPTAPAPNSPAAKSQERGQALKNALGFGDKNKPSASTTPAPKADTSSDAAKPGTWGNPKTSNPLIAKNREMVAKQQATGVNQAPGRAGRGSYDMAPGTEAPKKAADVAKPKTNVNDFKRPMNGALDSGNKPPKQAQAAAAKPAAAPTSNDTSKPAATGAASLTAAQGKETETKAPEAKADETPSFSTTHPDISKAEKKAPTMQKRASILPADTMAKQVASTRATVAKGFEADKGDNEGDSEPKQAEAPKQAAETPAPKAEKPAEDSNTKTDADGRTYVRQKGVMGSPDTWNRSYASGGDFLNKLKGKGDVNGKVAKEEYINKTFGLSDKLAASIMEVMKKKEGSAPRNDKEQDLAAHYGDPKRITHGDILVARGVIKPKKLKEGTMRNGKYVDDAPRPGTNEVPSPDEGYRGPGKPLYTPVDNKKPAKKAQSVQKESKDTPGNSYEHQCAIHVKSESFGEGRTITTQHADPDQDGNIAWYDVMFEHGIEKFVPTSDLEILVSESHMHAKRKKAVSEGNMYKSEAERQAAADERTNAQIAKMRERAKQGLGFNVGTINTNSPEVQGDVTNVPNATASQTAKPAAPAPAAAAPVPAPAAAKPAAPAAAAPTPAPAPAAPAPAQAAAVPPPAGETPEEKAKKAAAAKPLPRSKSFSGQGMEGSDF